VGGGDHGHGEGLGSGGSGNGSGSGMHGIGTGRGIISLIWALLEPREAKLTGREEIGSS